MKKRFDMNKKRDESAVSEAIGFTLIFSLVMIGIGLITLYGYPVLLETQSSANVRNMERDMIVLQNDMKSLVYKNVPYKETALQVSGGALHVESSTFAGLTGSTFKIETVNNGTKFDEKNCGALRYESDSAEDIVVLENGAVLVRQEFQKGSSMIAEPRWFIDTTTNTFIVNMVDIISDQPMSKIGMMTVKMKSTAFSPTEVLNPGDVTVTYKSDSDPAYDFSKGWQNYLEALSGNSADCDTVGNTTTCEYIFSGIDTLIIKKFEISIYNI